MAHHAGMHDRPSPPDRLAGGVWGHLVGDAVGVPYEFLPPSAIGTVRMRGGGHWGQPAGTWSDDGALMLALLDSLLEHGFDTTDQGRRALDWFGGTAYTPDGDGRFDVGGATRRALERVRDGSPAEGAGGTGERDQGNGSLMRILPLALVERDAPDATLVDHAHRASAVTHGHAVAQAACALYCLAARRLLAGDEPDGALAGARTTLRTLYAGDAARLAALDRVEAHTGRAGGGWVVDAFWSAWDAFEGAGSYREAIEHAVGYGGDTDTTACIAGGLAGIRFGVRGIPADWLAGMRGREVAAPLVARLVEGARGSGGDGGTPIRVNRVDLSRAPGLADAPGALGMTFLPGKRGHGQHGEHRRDLVADAHHLRTHWGVERMVLLPEDHELAAWGVPDVVGMLRVAGIDVVRHPVVDQGVPADRASFGALLRETVDAIRGGASVAVACVGGLGRTGTTVACLLKDAGLDAGAAIDLTRASRPGTIENDVQERFVRDW